MKLRAFGASMSPAILSGTLIELEAPTSVCVGDVLFVRRHHGADVSWIVHRVKKVKAGCFLLQGDTLSHEDGWFSAEDVLGKVKGLVFAKWQWRACPRMIQVCVRRTWMVCLPAVRSLQRVRFWISKWRHPWTAGVVSTWVPGTFWQALRFWTSPVYMRWAESSDLPSLRTYLLSAHLHAGESQLRLLRDAVYGKCCRIALNARGKVVGMALYDEKKYRMVHLHLHKPYLNVVNAAALVRRGYVLALFWTPSTSLHWVWRLCLQHNHCEVLTAVKNT